MFSVVLLCGHAGPSGAEAAAGWRMREDVPPPPHCVLSAQTAAGSWHSLWLSPLLTLTPWEPDPTAECVCVCGHWQEKGHEGSTHDESEKQSTHTNTRLFINSMYHYTLWYRICPLIEHDGMSRRLKTLRKPTTPIDLNTFLDGSNWVLFKIHNVI